VRDSWTDRVSRANQLARANHTDETLLRFYAELLTLQRQCYEHMRVQVGRAASGSLRRDLSYVRHVVPLLSELVASRGPQLLAQEAVSLLEQQGMGVVDDMLMAYWQNPSDRQFFAKAALQPYVSWLAECGIRPTDRGLPPCDNRCPFCGGSPQLSILYTAADAAGGGRLLLCATCLTTWSFRRVVCASCGEEDEGKLSYFHAPEFEHLRVDACDSCRHYLKAVDLTRLGLAVPIVDEVAGAPLDIWAREHGYEKIELNLLGL
jgi:formate dehydrogenase accessory protein FdhE